ncbi:MAG: NAD(P)-binding protein, partial [Prevotella sp.]|nr:NAD(P)-binding protein [Prevotella sp.]
MRIAIVGAGAAGCFAAVNLKRMCPQADITIYEGERVGQV